MGCYSITELASAFNLQVQVPIYTVTWVEHLTQEHHTMTPPWPGLEPGQLWSPLGNHTSNLIDFLVSISLRKKAKNTKKLGKLNNSQSLDVPRNSPTNIMANSIEISHFTLGTYIRALEPLIVKVDKLAVEEQASCTIEQDAESSLDSAGDS